MLVNAIELKNFLREPVTGDFNPEMVKRYPEMKGIVTVTARQNALVPVRKG